MLTERSNYGFNSTLVQLKASEIKGDGTVDASFQFYLSSIKRIRIDHNLEILNSFNSTLVQLKGEKDYLLFY